MGRKLTPQERFDRRMKALRTEAIRLDAEYHAFASFFPSMKEKMATAHALIKETLANFGVPCAPDRAKVAVNPCGFCRGYGSVPKHDDPRDVEPCPDCHGSGKATFKPDRPSQPGASLNKWGVRRYR